MKKAIALIAATLVLLAAQVSSRPDAMPVAGAGEIDIPVG